MRFAHFVLLATILAVTSAPTRAYTQKEADVLLNVSYAVATAGNKNRKGAEAFCRQAKGMLSEKPEDAYLFAHIERCFGAVAATIGDKPIACKRYKKALHIWQRTPPPDDHPQSVASRAQLRDGMIRYRKENCAA
jgi:hypothetical protein